MTPKIYVIFTQLWFHSLVCSHNPEEKFTISNKLPKPPMLSHLYLLTQSRVAAIISIRYLTLWAFTKISNRTLSLNCQPAWYSAIISKYNLNLPNVCKGNPCVFPNAIYFLHHVFLSDPGLLVRSMCLVSETESDTFLNLTDVTLADKETNLILTDKVNRVIQSNVAMQVTQPSGQPWNYVTYSSGATWWPILEPIASDLVETKMM